MSDHVIDTEVRNGVRIRWYYDQFSASNNPRQNSNVGTIATWHRRYKIGDEQPKESSKEHHAKLPEGTIMLPVYMYDHSGLAFNTTGFHCPWDSGQLGVIYATPDKIKAEGWDPVADLEKIKDVLRAEVDEWGKWVNGEVYGFVLTDDETGEKLDSCWGHIGWEWAQQAAREEADGYADTVAKRKAAAIEAERLDMYAGDET